MPGTVQKLFLRQPSDVSAVFQSPLTAGAVEAQGDPVRGPRSRTQQVVVPEVALRLTLSNSVLGSVSGQRQP